MIEPTRKNLYQKVTEKILNKSASRVDALFEKFHTDFLSERSGIPAMTLRSWKSRGKLSATVTAQLCKIPEVVDAGFTREQLRPDILVWFDEIE